MENFLDKKVQKFTLTSPAQTRELGEVFGKQLHGGDIVAYKGGMGAGKTTFTVGVVKGVGCEADVSSPTFSIINEYRGGKYNICHIDAFRLSSGEELESIAYYDYLDNGWIILIEWSEQLEGYLNEARFVLEFERLDDQTREITFTAK